MRSTLGTLAACSLLSLGASPASAQTYLPQFVMAMPGFNELEAAIVRYKDRDPDSLQPTVKGGLLGARCKSEPGREMVLGRVDEASYSGSGRLSLFVNSSYVGESRPGTCLPEGMGRIDLPEGRRWIGRVTWLREGSPAAGKVKDHPRAVPDGIGVLIEERGPVKLLELRYALPGSSAPGDAVATRFGASHLRRYLGAFVRDPKYPYKDDGRFVVYDIAESPHPDIGLWVGMLRNYDLVGTAVLPDGVSYRGVFEGHGLAGLPTHERLDPNLGTTFLGSSFDIGIYSSRPNQYIRLTRPLAGYAPGYYEFKHPTQAAIDLGRPETWTDNLIPVAAERFERVAAKREVDNTASAEGEWRREAQAMLENDRRREAEMARYEAERRRQQAADAEEDREHEALMARTWDQIRSAGQARNARLQQDLADINRRGQEAQAAGDAVARQRAEQDRLNREEAARQERDRQAGEQAYAEAQARNAQAKAQAEAAYQQQRQIDQARAQAAASDAARRAAGAYGSGSSSSTSSSSGTSSSTAAPAIPAGKQYTAIKDECGQLGRDYMAAKTSLEFRCLRQKRDDETFTAWREAQNTCMAEGKGEVDSLQAEYSACSKRDPSEGGVVRY